MRSGMLVQFIVLFVLTNALGMVFANSFLPPEVNEQISRGVTLVNDDKTDPVNAVALILYILFATAVLLVAIRFFQSRLSILLRLVEGIAVFFIVIAFFEVIVFTWIEINEFTYFGAILVALCVVILRTALPENRWLRNGVIVLLVAYVGALLGMGLGILPVALFLVLLSIYDYIAVFKTRHMVTLANAVTKKNLAFSYAIPTPEHQFELGTGDIAMPLALASSTVQFYSQALVFPYYFLPAILVLVGSFVGLLLTLEYSSRNIGKPLPALPLQTVLMLFFLAILFLLIPVRPW